MEMLSQALWLALIQGLTEFLPVSSSAHLILPSAVLGWPDQGQAFDVAVHLGTLIAVVSYFFRDIWTVSKGCLVATQQRTMNPNAALGLALVIGTIPAVLAGGLFHDFIADNLRSSSVIALATIGFGLLLWAADKTPARTRTLAQMTLMTALVIGCAQALALIPGTSRSGITITAALFLGFERISAARFSMLLSIPIIVAASVLEIANLVADAEPVAWGIMAIGLVAAAVSAFACIHVFMRLIERIGMTPFVIYRLVLGAALLLMVGIE